MISQVRVSIDVKEKVNDHEGEIAADDSVFIITMRII